MPDRDHELTEDYKAIAGARFKPIDANRLEQYSKIVKEAKLIFADRNAMYRDAFTALGLIGTVSTLIGDTFRLKFMIYDSDDYGKQYKEQIRDKLLDIINQAIISIFVLDDDNYRGK